MDRRSQRLLLLALLFSVTLLLYRSFNRAGGAAGIEPPAGATVDLRGVKPANSTLGVRLPPSRHKTTLCLSQEDVYSLTVNLVGYSLEPS